MNLTGNLGGASLPELIEDICLQDQTGNLRVEGSQQSGRLSFQDGELVDAEFGGETGPEAVYLALSLSADSSYAFEPGTLASRRTINEPWQRVVLQGFCRWKKAMVSESGPATYKRGAAAEPEMPSLESLKLSLQPPVPRHFLPIKRVAVASVGVSVIVVVVGAAVIASYSGGRGEKNRSQAPPLNTQGSVAPAASAALDANIPPPTQENASVTAQLVNQTNGRDSAPGQAEGLRTDAAGKESSSTPAPADGPTSEATTGDWFVILKTFPKKEPDKAADSSDRFKSLGHVARVIDTDDYPNFRGGMWAVVLGPYSSSTAAEVAQKLRSQIPDVYAKPGSVSSPRE